MRHAIAAIGALAVFVLGLGPASGSGPAVQPLAASTAFAIKIVVPGQAQVISAAVTAPKNANGYGAGFSYPADGSILTSGSVTSNAAANPSAEPTASAGVQVTDLSLFNGEVTVARVNANVTASADTNDAGGDFSGSGVTGIGGSAVVGGKLGDWGQLKLGAGNGKRSESSTWHTWNGAVTALEIDLTAAHGGLPAGSQIIVGFAAAHVQSRAVVLQPGASTGGLTHQAPSAAPGAFPTLPIGKIPTVQPKLTAGHYVFPVYGPASYGDSFGAPRGDVSGGWHHGDDIFAPLGAPILAVADGTVYSVGWNKVGGWRLWLRDQEGNEFYYAHLSAYSPFAQNRAQVKAGTVLGFVGNTGDAEGTPTHLHFEVHPVMLLPLGYDGAVDPTPYLDAWRRLQDIKFSTAGEWLPGLTRLTSGRAPAAGAILLQMSDISSASGLDPGSLQRVLEPVSSGR
jgi:murein DD-endopeptidase MepM/ murein hydrolase activator NlpD